jgi:hypothetical protein
MKSFKFRRKFVSQIGLGLAAVPLLSLIYGITVGKYNIKSDQTAHFFFSCQMLLMVLRLLKFQMMHGSSFDDPEKKATP